jgi:hypothetical protein
MTKHPHNFKRFWVTIYKNANTPPVEYIVEYLRKATRMMWEISSEVTDKARLATPEISNRKIRKKWKGREIDIPDLKERRK